MSSAAVSTRKAKRSRTSEDALAIITASGGTGSSSSSSSACNTCPILQSELEALKSDLEHETNLRSIEQRRHSQAETRLRRQLTLATEEADEARSALEDLRATSEADVAKAREARRAALARLARAEEAAERYRQKGAGEDTERVELAGDARLLRERVASLEEERNGLRIQLEEEIEANRERAEAAEAAAAENTPKRAKGEEADAADSKKTALSAAPPAVMSELNRIRIKLAEAERTNRQLTRKLTAVQSVADSAVRHKEEARSAKSRLERVEAELTELRREREDRRAVESRWVGFRKDIVKALGKDTEDSAIDSSDEEADGAATMGGRVDTPPEVSLVVRIVQKLQEEMQTARRHLAKARSDLELQRQMATEAEKRLEGAAASESALKKKLVEAESRADNTDLELRKLCAQQDVWKREADSLRSLLETYERSEVQPPTHKTEGKGGANALAADDGEGPTIQGLRTSLNSAQEQIRLLTEEATTLKAETSSAKTESETAQTELARVKEKFGKLRDALFKEREKAEKAEARACQAETMAGKGSFDSDSTRVLHLKENPLMDAVRAKYEAEIDALRKALQEKSEESSSGTLSGSSGSAAKTPLPGRSSPSAGSDQSVLDAQKLHRRLKESFREQIGKFREGVYLLTGFKIDMMADSTPLRFKVRSLYAEREEDHLMFAWPNVKKGEAVTSLDLLDTPQAQLLAQDQSFEYMTKFKSLPAFLASVQLGLFEKQTFAG
jgi:mitotic spindle assembly checkpoint protein MAD1